MKLPETVCLLQVELPQEVGEKNNNQLGKFSQTIRLDGTERMCCKAFPFSLSYFSLSLQNKALKHNFIGSNKPETAHCPLLDLLVLSSPRRRELWNEVVPFRPQLPHELWND